MRNEPPTNDPRRLRRYLLGDLPEADQLNLEARYFAEQELFDALCACEYDLIDDYLTERLPSSERQQFEAYFLQTPDRRANVAAASLLLNSLPPAAEPAKAEPATGWLFRVWSWSDRSFRLSYAGGLSVLLLLGVILSGWLIRSYWRPSTQPSPTARAAPAGPEKDSPSLAPALPAPPAEPPTARTSPPQLATVVTVTLTGIAMRSTGGQTIRISPATKTLQLKLALEEPPPAHYRVVLHNAEGVELWQQTKLPGSARTAAPVITIQLPAQNLPAGDYQLSLQELTATQRYDHIKNYQFRLLRH